MFWTMSNEQDLLLGLKNKITGLRTGTAFVNNEVIIGINMFVKNLTQEATRMLNYFCYQQIWFHP